MGVDLFAPAWQDAEIDIEEVEQAASGVGDGLFQRFWVGVEHWHWWRDDGAGLSDRDHVAQVDEVEGGFAHSQNQAAAFCESDIGGAVEQV